MSFPPPPGRAVSVVRLAAPLTALFLIQNAVQLFAVARVGQQGDGALAGLGVGSAVFGLLLALLFGFDTGVQAVVARKTGAGQGAQAGQALTDGLAVSVPVGLLLALVAAALGPHAVALLLQDPAAASAGAAYLRAAAPSILFLSLTIPANAYWIASGRPAIAFLVTCLVAPLQIAITWPLVSAGGAGGAGLASSLAALAGLAIQAALVLRLRPAAGFLRRGPDAAGVATILRIGWPVSAQQSLLQFGLMLAFAIVSQLGVAQAAVLNVLASLTLVPIQMATGLGVAAGALVGQALGRGDPQDARRWGWQVSIGGALVMLPLGLLAALAPRAVLGFFLTEPATLELAVWPVQVLGLGVAIDAVGRILGFALRGAGATKSATIIPFVVQWLAQLPLMWWVGVKLGYGLNGVVAVQFSLALVEAVALALIWRGGGWTRVRIASLPAGDLPPARPRAGGPMTRIAILGGAGSGKSTLARGLGERMGLPVIHLDRLVYGPDWTLRETGEVRADLARALASGRWIVDGAYPELGDLILPQADLVLWIDQPAWRRLFRAWRKTVVHRGRSRSDRPDGCEEAFGLDYALAILRVGRWTPQVSQALHSLARGPVVRLKGDRDVADFLVAIAPSRPVAREPISAAGAASLGRRSPAAPI